MLQDQSCHVSAVMQLAEATLQEAVCMGNERARDGSCRVPQGACLEGPAHSGVGEEELPVELGLGVAQHLVHIPLHAALPGTHNV